jgi:hypothetical protein
VSWRLGSSIIKISNRFAALEILSGSKGINRAWENIKDNIKTSTKQFCKNGTIINHGLMKNVHNFWIKGIRLKCSGYRIQTKAV